MKQLLEFLVNKPIKHQVKTYKVYIGNFKLPSESIPLVRIHSIEDVNELIEDDKQREDVIDRIEDFIKEFKYNFEDTLIGLQLVYKYSKKRFSWDDIDKYKVIDNITAEQFNEKYFKQKGYKS